MFEAFAPMEELAPHLPSLPPKPLSVMREVGTPRPASHHLEYGGMQVPRLVAAGGCPALPGSCAASVLG